MARATPARLGASTRRASAPWISSMGDQGMRSSPGAAAVLSASRAPKSQRYRALPIPVDGDAADLRAVCGTWWEVFLRYCENGAKCDTHNAQPTQASVLRCKEPMIRGWSQFDWEGMRPHISSLSRRHTWANQMELHPLKLFDSQVAMAIEGHMMAGLPPLRDT